MEYPLYLTIEQASKISGIGQNAIRDWLNSSDPIPHIKVGNKRLISRLELSSYLKKKEVKT